MVCGRAILFLLVFIVLCNCRIVGEQLGSKHWSFRPLLDAQRPVVPDDAWGRTRIDSFILRKLRDEGLVPQPEATRNTLVRRLYSALTGLPPTPAQVRAFVADERPKAYQRLVDRLLGDEQFGVRWARHWLDVARFGESDGILNVNGDKVRKDAWRYRDAVIRALNDDLPFDSFVRIQLAGASGDDSLKYRELRQFIHLGTHLQDNDNPNDRQFHRLDDMVSTTGSAFLGLTFGCARCHDHPVDPMSTKEYYQFTSFFFDQFEEEPKSGKRPVALVIHKPRLLHKGSWRTPGENVNPGFLSVLMKQPSKHWLTKDRSNLQALAAWLTDAKDGAGQQLARVIVNRIWHHHFGRGLVDTPNDFGILGSQPSHPELLDWLAGQLIKGGWKLKPIHRLLLNSSVFRQAGARDSSATEKDAENRLLWQFRPRRLEAEVIRDRLLSVAGVLRTELYGSSIPIGNYKVSEPDDEKQWRRSIYLQVHRTGRQRTLSLFDPANNEKSVGVRSSSASADAALFAMNSPLMWELAQRFARRVRREAGEESEDQIRYAYLTAFARPPRNNEMKIAAGLLTDDAGALTNLCHVLLSLNEFIYLN